MRWPWGRCQGKQPDRAWRRASTNRKHEELTDEERLEHFRVARDQLLARLKVLSAQRDVPEGLAPQEFHASIRVPYLPSAARFYNVAAGRGAEGVDASVCDHKPARTMWRGTPLHELWLKDPGGNLIEIYARLTEAERAEMPVDMEPVFIAGET